MEGVPSGAMISMPGSGDLELGSIPSPGSYVRCVCLFVLFVVCVYLLCVCKNPTLVLLAEQSANTRISV